MSSKRILVRNEKGFTLVELLVVIIIIGILAAVAVPAFLNQRQKANEAALKSDLKSVATTIADYQAGGGSWDKLRADTGMVSTVIWVGAGQESYSPTALRWNDLPGLSSTKISNGSVVVMDIIKTSGGAWDAPHAEGDYCLHGTIANSHYNYPGGNPALYDTMLYYDVSLGGLVKMDAIVKARQDGRATSCTGWGKYYMQAKGII